MTLLSIAMLADKRVRDPELVEFCHQVKKLNRIYFPERILTSTMIRKWIADNQDKIAARLNAGDSDDYVVSRLNAISHKNARVDLLRGMFSICICDYEYLDEEADLLKLAFSTWGVSVADQELASV